MAPLWCTASWAWIQRNAMEGTWDIPGYRWEFGILFQSAGFAHGDRKKRFTDPAQCDPLVLQPSCSETCAIFKPASCAVQKFSLDCPLISQYFYHAKTSCINEKSFTLITESEVWMPGIWCWGNDKHMKNNILAKKPLLLWTLIDIF